MTALAGAIERKARELGVWSFQSRTREEGWLRRWELFAVGKNFGLGQASA